SAYCHGELRSEESGRVAEHLMNCRRCREEYEEIKFGARLASHLLTREQAPAALWAELEAMLDEKSAPVQNRGAAPARRRSFWSLSPFKLAAAAAMVLIIGFGVFWYQRRTSPKLLGPKPSWEVTRIEGQPLVGSKAIGEVGRLSLGEWL